MHLLAAEIALDARENEIDRLRLDRRLAIRAMLHALALKRGTIAALARRMTEVWNAAAGRQRYTPDTADRAICQTVTSLSWA